MKALAHFKGSLKRKYIFFSNTAEGSILDIF